MVREFVPLPVRGMGFSHGRVNRFEYFETDHPDLPAKLPSLKIPGPRCANLGQLADLQDES